jgi:hypothetical protein
MDARIYEHRLRLEMQLDHAEILEEEKRQNS